MQSWSETRALARASRAKMSGGIFKTADIAQFESASRKQDSRLCRPMCGKAPPFRERSFRCPGGVHQLLQNRERPGSQRGQPAWVEDATGLLSHADFFNQQ